MSRTGTLSTMYVELDDFSLRTRPFHGIPLFALLLKNSKPAPTNAALFACVFSFFLDGLICNVPKPNYITGLLRNMISSVAAYYETNELTGNLNGFSQQITNNMKKILT